MKEITRRIIAFNEPLLKDKVAIKYQLMSENVFRFYRGTCHLFFEDLAKRLKQIPKSPLAWLSGDLHLENFGSYKAGNQLVYFDLNDFDEALLAPALWEVLRMVTSIFLAFYALKMRKKQAEHMARLFLHTYAATLSRGKAQYIEPQTSKGIVCTFLNAVASRDQEKLLVKRTVLYKNKLQLLVNGEKHFAIDKVRKKRLTEHIKNWIRHSSDGPYHYKVRDVVFRLAGTGSVGVYRYLFLLQSKLDKKQYMFLDMKEARPSSLARYVRVKQPQWKTEAERVVSVADRMQSQLPSQFSATVFDGIPYVLEEMQPSSDKVNFELIKDRYRDVYQVIDDMAMLTASAQLRSSGRQGAACVDDLIRFGNNIAKWLAPVLSYTSSYAEEVKKQYKDFCSDYGKW